MIGKTNAGGAASISGGLITGVTNYTAKVGLVLTGIPVPPKLVIAHYFYYTGYSSNSYERHMIMGLAEDGSYYTIHGAEMSGYNTNTTTYNLTGEYDADNETFTLTNNTWIGSVTYSFNYAVAY